MTTIDASSDPNDAEQKDNPDLSPSEHDATEGVVKPKLAMIVDEHRGNRLRLEVRLLSAGVRSKTFSTGEAAMKALLSGELDMPDVIIVGEKTPHLEGLQVVKYIKRLPRAAKIPQLHYCIKRGDLCVVQARTLGAVGADAEEFDAVDLDDVLAHLNLAERIRNVSAGDEVLEEKDCTLKALASEVDAHLDEMLTDDAAQQLRQEEQTDAGEIELSVDSDVDAAEIEAALAACSERNIESQHADQEMDDSTPEDITEGVVEDEDPFAEKPPKRLVDSQSLKGLITASASNDAESFREHSSVVAYLRSLERKTRRSPPNRRKSDQWHEKRRQQRRKMEATANSWREALSAESRVTNNRMLGLESQRLEFQERLDRSLESLQHQFEFELMRQTGAIQESVGEMMDAHAETIRDQLLTAGHHQRLDRWLRILIVVVLLLMPSLWLLTQPAVQSQVPLAVTDVADEALPVSVTPRIAEQTEAPIAAGLTLSERERVTQAVEQLLNSGATPEFGTTALGLREATRLEQALEMLSVVEFKGVIQVINHVSPYCVQYDGSGKAFLDESQETISQCFMAPENIVDAEAQASDQSIEFGNLLSRYNRPDVPINIVVKPAVAEGDFWSVTETFEPSATGEKLTASDWNDRARLRNRVEYRLIAQPSQTAAQ